MAVPYENMTDEARRRQRQDRLRMREVWPRDTQEGRLYYESAKAIASMWEACEDAIFGLGGDERGKEETAIGVLRQAVGQARQAYKRLDMAAKLGLNAVDKVFDRTAGEQDLDEEEEKLVKAFLKEEGSAGGGKVQKKREHAAKPYDRSEDEIGRAQPSPSAGMGGYGVGAGHMLNWGMGQQQQYTFAMPMTAPSFGGGILTMGGWSPMGMMMPSGTMHTPGGMQGGGQTGGAGKRKHPCDNCGAMDHWKYQPVCPNLHMHLEQQAAKHLASRQQTGQQAASPSGTAASPAADGSGTAAGRQGKCKARMAIIGTESFN
jgi:hypothetical protein